MIDVVFFPYRKATHEKNKRKSWIPIMGHTDKLTRQRKARKEKWFTWELAHVKRKRGFRTFKSYWNLEALKSNEKQ